MHPTPAAHRRRPRATLRLAVLAVPAAAALLVAGCGSSDNESAASPNHAAANAVTIKATEYAFAPSAVTVKAGKVKLTLDNEGKIEHEVVLLKGGQAAGSLKVKGGRVSEDTSVGEVSETAAGAKKSVTLDLQPGRYVLVCNIAGHYQGGMFGTLTVR
jgi:uncharacterized cupredoxin-like copper-binding protein